MGCCTPSHGHSGLCAHGHTSPCALFHWLPHPPVPTCAHLCPPTLTWGDQPGPEAAEPQEQEQRQQPHGMDGQCGGCLSGHRQGFKSFLGQKVGAHDLARAPAPDTLHPSVNPPVPSLLQAAAAGQASGDAGRCCCLVQGSVQPQESRTALQDKSSRCNFPLQQAGPGDPAWGWPGQTVEEAPRAGRCGAARGALAALRALFCLWEQWLVPEGRPVTGHGPQPHAALHLSARRCPAGPTPGDQESSRTMESCCWGQGGGGSGRHQDSRAGATSAVSLPEAERVLRFPSHGAQAASAPSMGLASLDTAECRKDGTGAAGAFPDSPFRECPSLGEAGGFTHSARVCAHVGAGCGHVCVRVQQPLCSRCAPALLLPWPGTSSWWHSAASVSVPVGYRIPGCSLGTPVPGTWVPIHCSAIDEVWLVALPSRLHPLLTLRVPGVRAGQGGTTQVLPWEWFSVL